MEGLLGGMRAPAWRRQEAALAPTLTRQDGSVEMLKDEGRSPPSMTELQCDAAEKCCERGRATLALLTQPD